MTNWSPNQICFSLPFVAPGYFCESLFNKVPITTVNSVLIKKQWTYSDNDYTTKYVASWFKEPKTNMSGRLYSINSSLIKKQNVSKFI